MLMKFPGKEIFSNIIKEIFSEVKLVWTEDAEGNDQLHLGPEGQ